jgi:histidinol-phosphate aminotransferase
MKRKNNPIIPHDKLRLHSAERNDMWENNIWESFIDSLRDTDVRYYPNVEEVRPQLKEFYNIPNGTDLMIGAGSDRCIKYFFELHSDKEVILSDPCFGMYNVYANMMGMRVISVPYQLGKFDVKNTIYNITKDSVVVLSNPSSPIGDVISRGDLLKILHCGVPTLVDEAYIEFSKTESVIQLTERFPNLFVIRSMSKAWGSAGVRVGVIISQNKNIENLMVYKDIDGVTQTKRQLMGMLIQHGYEIYDGHCNWVHIRSNTTIDLPSNIEFRTNCTIPGDYNSDWIRLQISTNIDDYQFLF